MTKFPSNFKSLQEYEAHKRCFNKIQPLDGIELDIGETLIVLGRKFFINKQKKDSYLLVGTNSYNVSFWSIYSGIERELEKYPEMIEYISKYKSGYWISINNRIAKLIRNKYDQRGT